jgi:hypothetical protein
VAEVPKAFNLQGLYAEVDARPLSWLALTAGVRADRNSLLDDRVSPRAALFASRDRFGAKLLYAEGFRNPSAYEGFFEDGIDFVGQPGDRRRDHPQLRGGGVGAAAAGADHAAVGLPLGRRSAGRAGHRDRSTATSGCSSPTAAGCSRPGSSSRPATATPTAGWRSAAATLTRVEDGDSVTRDRRAELWTAGRPECRRRSWSRRFHVSSEVQAIGARSTRVDGVNADGLRAVEPGRVPAEARRLRS